MLKKTKFNTLFVLLAIFYAFMMHSTSFAVSNTKQHKNHIINNKKIQKIHNNNKKLHNIKNKQFTYKKSKINNLKLASYLTQNKQSKIYQIKKNPPQHHLLNLKKSHIAQKNSRIEHNAGYAAIVIDTSRSLILYQKNAHLKRHPASLTKMMTLYLLFDALDSKKINMDSSIYISREANMKPPSSLYVKAGDKITAREAIYALIVKSANNISYAVAQSLSKNEQNFVAHMNRKAKELGMKNTHFVNAHGLHHPGQYTTAYDMAILGIALERNHPTKYQMFSMTKFNFRGQTINGHNHVLKRYPGVDGIKTGYVQASGFNLVTSVKNKEKGNLVAVVLGGANYKQRDDHMISLIDASYNFIDKKYNIHNKNQMLANAKSGIRRLS